MNLDSFIPHGFCLAWDPGLVWLQAGSDAAIAIAYYSIPAAMLVFLRRRADLAFRPIFALFAAFILACGTTHIMSVVTLFHPVYWIDGVIKAVTAALSVATAILLWPLLPKALALPSTAELARLNGALAQQIAERDAALAQLKESEDRLRHAQKMEAVGQLTGGIAHDFNNILTVIISGLELLTRRAEWTERSQRLAAGALESARRAARLTAQLLSFSRRARLTPEPLAPDAVVHGIEDLLAQTAGTQVRLQVMDRQEGGLWPVLADANQLESALINLVINARDALAGTAGEIDIMFRNVIVGGPDPLTLGPDALRPGDYVGIAVRDNGCGMTQDVLAHACEPFFTTKQAGAGSGLGLSQIYGFAVQSQGGVRIISAPGEGTTVEILLPRTADMPKRTGPAPRMEDKPRVPHGAGAVIVVVEDNAALRDTASEALRLAGYIVESAPDGPAGLSLLNSLPAADLLLTDIIMPGGMSGVDLAHAARARYPDLPVLFTTGFTAPPVLALWNEPADVLAKPFTIDDLVTRVSARLHDHAGTVLTSDALTQ